MEAVESMGLRMGCDTVHRVLVWQRFMRRVSGYAAGHSKQEKLCSCCDTRFAISGRTLMVVEYVSK